MQPTYDESFVWFYCLYYCVYQPDMPTEYTLLHILISFLLTCLKSMADVLIVCSCDSLIVPPNNALIL